MNRKARLGAVLTIGAAGLAFAVSAAAGLVNGGPPGLCQPYRVGDAGEGISKALEKTKGDPAAIIKTTLALLDKHESDASCRMEVLRQAIFALEAKSEKLEPLALELTARALSATGGDKKIAAAEFDAGFLIYNASVLSDGRCDTLASKEGVPGYAIVDRALARHDDPQMHVGACFMTTHIMHDRAKKETYSALFRAHARKAAASTDALVTKNLEMVLPMEGLTIEQVRASASTGTAKPASR